MSDRHPLNPHSNSNSNNNHSSSHNNTSSNADKQDESSAPTSDFRQTQQQQQPQQPPPSRPPSAASGRPQPLPPPLPHELTAEWTVRAQLTFARAGDPVRREFSSGDPVNPVRVVYKWSTLDTATDVLGGGGGGGADDDDVDVDVEDDTSSATLHSHKRFSSGRFSSGQSTPLKASTGKQTPQQPHRHESFRSTTSSTNADFGGGDSAFSGSNTSKKPHRDRAKGPTPHHQHQHPRHGHAPYGTRCRSTCNIVVSAVADFLPSDASSSTPASDLPPAFMTTAGGADFIPEEESDPFVFNTTACYTVLPEKSFDESASKNFTSYGKILALRDAFSQTSDTETKYFEEQQRRRCSSSRSPIERRQQQQTSQQQQQQHHLRQPYDHRRATTEALLRPTEPRAFVVDEGNSFMPSFAPSPTQTFKSASLPSIPPRPGQPPQQQQQPSKQPQPPASSKAGAPEQQKKPRTVHIDVYCTGSEEDEDDEVQADGEGSSSSASSTSGEDGGHRHELESNSTPQTVLDNEQMMLRHQRITGRALPRRIAQQQQQQHQQLQSAGVSSKTPSSGDLNLGHAITKSSTAEEVSESKQLLFRKHIGDQRAAKIQTLRQKYMRQPSDDALSSNYPNSSRSTVRDATCSSISSAVPSSPAADYGGVGGYDSSWKESEEHEGDGDGEGDGNTTAASFSLAKSDSFEYENSLDRMRIRQMERFWSHGGAGTGTGGFSSDDLSPPSRSHALGHGPAQAPGFLQPISEGNSQRASPYRAAAPGPVQRPAATLLPSGADSEPYSETDVFYTYPGRGAQAPAHHTPPLQQSPRLGRGRPGFLQFFGPPTPSPELRMTASAPAPAPASAPVLPSAVDSFAAAAAAAQSQAQSHLLYPDYRQMPRWRSETRENPPSDNNNSNSNSNTSPSVLSPRVTPVRCGSEAPPSLVTSAPAPAPSVAAARRFDMKQPSPAISEASTVVSGYTSEYLEKARKFGKVVATTRKPGHHVGPTKNPSCLCESCQRWLAERFQMRSRAFSLGERPVLKRPT